MTVHDALATGQSGGLTHRPAPEETESAGELEVGSISMDEVFHVLQNRRRRDVLRYMQGTTGSVVLSDLAEQVAAWEHDTTVEALSSKERKRVYVALYQAHLPKLDETGVIEYDRDRGRLRRTARADLFDPYLERADPGADTDGDDEEQDVSTARASGGRFRDYYLGASALGGVLLSLAGLDVPIFSALSGFQVATIILLAFATLTVWLPVARPSV